jgi:transcriptional regulator with AAA-type ATPase domain/tetratricopeptide (TPR) repeat protein
MDELLGESHAIALVREQARHLLARGQRAHRLPPILLQGETGTGKGLLARLLHRGGPRRDGPFIDVSCAAIPDTLVEAELFGFERGAFTDARHAKAGLLHAAHQGTIFLDELALLPEAFQAKLLKAIEERAVRRLGSTRAETVDVQIIAASNEDLAAAVRNQRFRDDLYHRLAVVTLTLPPLRERPEDVLLLAEHFLSRACADYGLVPPRRFAPDARCVLQEYPWPGNVRELSNVVERAVLLTENSTITAPMLRLSPRSSTNALWSRFDEQVGDLEREKLLGALDDTNWNVSRAAIRLGISRNRLRYRIEKHRLHADRYVLHSGQRHLRSGERAAPTSAVDPLTTAKTVELRWEPRHLALLRAELVPSATAGPPPDPVRAFTVIADKIRGFGGRVQELAPMMILGAFGLEPLENAPNSAALAALAIQKAAQRARRVDSRAPAVKIAVHATQLMVDPVNGVAHLKLDDTGTAESPWTALSDVGQANSILISAAAAPFLERRFELARQPSWGDAGPLYRLIGRERTGFGLGERALAPFVGRQHELAIVCAQLAQAERERGQIVAVVGEPGAGKSRFIYELTRADCARGWRFLSSRAVSYGVSTPLLPIIELLKSYFDIEDRDDARRVREKATSKLLTLDRALEPHLVPLLALLDVAVDDESWKPLDPVQKRLRTLDACKRLILREAQVRPLAVIFEDLHWIDGETQALLDSLVESLPTARLLLMVSFRPEYQVRWGSRTYYTQLRIDPLTGENTEELLRTLLGTDPSLEPLARLLIERTEGNPLYLEESVRSLVETGELQGSRGAYRLAAPLTSIQVPATVQAILAARIDRLAPEDKHLLQAAAAIGKDAPYTLLHMIVELSEELLRQRLGTLQAGEFLYEKSLFPDLEYTFKHALTHEVAYGSVLQERRKTLHTRIMESIERLYHDRLAEQVERLAHHALCGEAWDKALIYSRQAAEKAIGRSAHREASSHLERAIAVLPHLPQTRATLEQAVDLRLAARTCLAPLGEYARWLELAREAEPLAIALDDPRRESLVHCSVSVALAPLGRSAEAIEHGERAMAIAEALQEPTLRIAARYALGFPRWFLGAHRTAINFFQRDVGLEPEEIPARLLEPWGAEVFQEAFTRVSYSMTQSLAPLCFAELGEFDQASLQAERAVKFALTLDILFLRAIADSNLGSVHLRKGDLQKALHLAQRWLRTYATGDLPLAQLVMAATLGEAFNLSGRLDDAVALFDRAWQFAESKSLLAWGPRVLALLGDAYGRAGRIDEAVTTGERALHLAHELGQHGQEARTLYLLGNIHGYGAPANASLARDSYQQALVLAQELGMRPLAAECHLALGELAKKAGEGRSAQEQFSTALSMFREMCMQLRLEKAESAVKELSAQ